MPKGHKMSLEFSCFFFFFGTTGTRPLHKRTKQNQNKLEPGERHTLGFFLG
jgi:hypothetical protein